VALPLVTEKQTDKQATRAKLDGFPYQEQQEISKAYYEKLRKLPPSIEPRGLV